MSVETVISSREPAINQISSLAGATSLVEPRSWPTEELVIN